MFIKSTLLATLSFLGMSLAHFEVTYPAGRGDNGDQNTAPCGGLGVSSTRTKWPLAGGRLTFEAGHEEAHTTVLLSLKENPSSDDDFNIVLAPLFNQVGLGTFCWPDLKVPNGTAGVKDGAKATIQVKQGGHGGGWLYNCADIEFSSNPPKLTDDCANSSGISSEALTENGEDAGADASSIHAVLGGVLGAVVVVAAMVF